MRKVICESKMTFCACYYHTWNQRISRVPYLFLHSFPVFMFIQNQWAINSVLSIILLKLFGYSTVQNSASSINKNKTTYIKSTPACLNKSNMMAEFLSLCTVLFHLGLIPYTNPHETFLFKAMSSKCLQSWFFSPKCGVFFLTPH